MTTLRIDIETYSSVDLKTAGLYKYVESPDFEVLMIAYKFDNKPVQMKDIKGERIIMFDNEFKSAINNPAILKTAYNAAFEIACLSKFFDIRLDPKQWSCTMVKAAYLGVPFSLEKAGAVLQLDTVKDKEGKALIKYFSVPRKPTARDDSTRKFPEDDPGKWAKFKSYCITDVVVEEGVDTHVSQMVNIPRFEKELWFLDQKINSRGVLVDLKFVNAAIRVDQDMREALLAECKKITGLANPNSTAQIKKWLFIRGYAVDSMSKENIDSVVELVEFDTDAIRVVEIWRELSKSSVKKYYTMLTCACKDGRVKGMFQFGGAQRTTRWAGRLVQLHNLLRNHMKDLDTARKIVGLGDYEFLKMMYDNPSFVLSQLIRTSFIPSKDCKFITSDFSAIEARVTAWYAQEQWRLKVFATHGKIYEASASMMFDLPIDQCQKGTKVREQGKVAELALGYGGGVNALVRMDSRGDIEPKMYQVIVDKWRKASPKIKSLWRDLNEAAVGCVSEGGVWKVSRGNKYTLEFTFKHGVMYIKLPCGRKLMYYQASVIDGKYGPVVTYGGMNQVTGKWERQSTYGGKLLENIVQATSRDLLAVKMLELEAAGLPVVIHVHDEIVTDVAKTVNIKVVDEIMAKPVDWAPGLPLKGDSYECSYYRKD